jgi:hypothetical protein
MKHALLALFAIALLPAGALAGCGGPGGVVDMRTDAQYRADVDDGRVRCVVFVLSGSTERPRQGWVEWHHERAGGGIDSTRLGLYPAGPRNAPAFGRVPAAVRPEPGAARLVVVLPTSYWLLVNTTRLGWQMRAGLVDDPDRRAVRKLFTDVGLNAGLGDAARSLAGIAGLARGHRR